MHRSERQRIVAAAYLGQPVLPPDPVLPGTQHGHAFRSCAFADDAVQWRAAVFEADKGWSVFTLTERGGVADRQQQRVAERLSLADAVRHVAGWEALQRAEGQAPVAAAEALGFQHIALFLAREGLVAEAGGALHRIDPASGTVLAEGQFAAADIALAQRHALPAGSARPLGDLAARYRPLIALPQDDSWGLSGFRGGAAVVEFMTAIADVPNADLAGRLLQRGLDLNHADLAVGGQHRLRDATLRHLGSAAGVPAVELLLELGLNPRSPHALLILTYALASGSAETVGLLAPRVGPLLQTMPVGNDALQHPAILQQLLRAGLSLDSVQDGLSHWQRLCAQPSDAGLQTALICGAVPPAEGPNLLVHAIESGASACARRLLLSGYADRRGEAGWLEAMRAAIARPAEDLAVLGVTLRRDLAPQLADPALLQRIVTAPMPALIETLRGVEPVEDALCTAALRHGTAEALDAAIRCGMVVGTLLNRDPALVAHMLTPERAAATAACIAYPEMAGRALFAALAEAGGGDPLRHAAAVGSPALAAGLRRLYTPQRPQPGADSALHLAAGRGPAALLAAVLGEGEVERSLLDAQGPRGATALHLAVRRRDRESVQLLLARGARVDIADDAGLVPGYYANLAGDRAMLDLLQPPVARPAARRRFGLGMLRR